MVANERSTPEKRKRRKRKASGPKAGKAKRKSSARGVGKPSDNLWEHVTERREVGVTVFTLESWRYFGPLIATAKGRLLYRGQRDPSWPLSSALDRYADERDLRTPGEIERLRRKHLKEFKAATRGRRDPAAHKLPDDEWWALGRHFGLKTPLLDWTESPYVAAYFAFEEPVDESAGTRPPSEANYRVVYGLSPATVKIASKLLSEGQRLRIVRSVSNENARLISQRGCFTLSEDGTDVGAWLSRRIGIKGEDMKLWRILIPEQDRAKFMINLNLMNINHLTLFPDDLYGASKYCNKKLTIRNY